MIVVDAWWQRVLLMTGVVVRFVALDAVEPTPEVTTPRGVTVYRTLTGREPRASRCPKELDR